VTCWFCQQPLMRRLNGQVRDCDNHHIIPKRYFGHGEDHEFRNLVTVHRDCHLRFHRQHDLIGESLEAFIDHMDALHFGKAIFAAARYADTLAAD
jgi:hypothetical protein